MSDISQNLWTILMIACVIPALITSVSDVPHTAAAFTCCHWTTGRPEPLNTYTATLDRCRSEDREITTTRRIPLWQSAEYWMTNQLQEPEPEQNPKSGDVELLIIEGPGSVSYGFRGTHFLFVVCGFRKRATRWPQLADGIIGIDPLTEMWHIAQVGKTRISPVTLISS